VEKVSKKEQQAQTMDSIVSQMVTLQAQLAALQQGVFVVLDIVMGGGIGA
jgi:hypothetical protein